jgi:predicted O-methyltransferase YrrM
MSDWIENIGSAWKGHRKFAEFLVEKINPNVVVELGVDYGYSTFVFANSLRGKEGKIYGIDLFAGDIDTGFRNTHKFVIDTIQEKNLTQVEIICGEFSEVAKTWNKVINILHIDGLHTYEAVKCDYETWYKFLDPNGIILFHDVVSFPEIGKFFMEVDDGWYKLYFTHSEGLGVFTKNKDLYNDIITIFSENKN